MFYLLFSPNKLSFSIFSWLACIFRQMGGLKIQMSNICIKMCAFSLPFLESCCFWTFRFLEKEKFFLTIVPCTWKGISLFSLHFIGWRSLSRYWDWEREETKLKRSVKRAVSNMARPPLTSGWTLSHFWWSQTLYFYLCSAWGFPLPTNCEWRSRELLWKGENTSNVLVCSQESVYFLTEEERIRELQGDFCFSL